MFKSDMNEEIQARNIRPGMILSIYGGTERLLQPERSGQDLSATSRTRPEGRVRGQRFRRFKEKRMTPREYLGWAVDRALYYFDQGERQNAIMSFWSDMNKNPDTKWITSAAWSMDILEHGYDEGRQWFEKAMRGFSV